MIRVCDAIMGSGKTESAITYINEHPDKKFIYITPYLDEANRIKRGCPDAHFVEPSSRLKEMDFKKLNHIASLIKQGRNITSTHAAFRRYTQEMLRDIRSQEYTLIIDESVDVLDEIEVNSWDIQVLVSGGYLKNNRGELTIDGCKEFPEDVVEGKGVKSRMFDLVNAIQTRRAAILLDDEKHVLIWQLPTNFVTAFADVIIMTYMIEGQELGGYLRANRLAYEKIGVKRCDDGAYRFGKYNEYIPEYVHDLPNKIHVLGHVKLNAVGKRKSALSMAWFQSDENKSVLRRHLENLKTNIWRSECGPGRFMWSSFKSQSGLSRRKGFKKSFLVFNARATNEYRDKDHLAYLANIYLNVGHKILFKRRGAPIDEDAYALSTMIQWIWRSAIRDGKEIWVYVPSSRMRRLLISWIDEVSKGGAATCTKNVTNAVTTELFAPVRQQMQMENVNIISPCAI